MRRHNLIKLHKGVYVDFTLSNPTAFSVISGTSGEIGFKDGGVLDVSKLKPNRIYNSYIDYGYCTNNEITIYDFKNGSDIFEILALTTEAEEPILSETTDNFFVTEYIL
jgi:hypothetical protein